MQNRLDFREIVSIHEQDFDGAVEWLHKRLGLHEVRKPGLFTLPPVDFIQEGLPVTRSTIADVDSVYPAFRSTTNFSLEDGVRVYHQTLYDNATRTVCVEGVASQTLRFRTAPRIPFHVYAHPKFVRLDTCHFFSEGSELYSERYILMRPQVAARYLAMENSPFYLPDESAQSRGLWHVCTRSKDPSVFKSMLCRMAIDERVQLANDLFREA